MRVKLTSYLHYSLQVANTDKEFLLKPIVLRGDNGHSLYVKNRPSRIDSLFEA